MIIGEIMGRVDVSVPKKDCWSMTFEVLTGNDPLVKIVGHFFTSIEKLHKECDKKFQTSLVAHIHYHSQRVVFGELMYTAAL